MLATPTEILHGDVLRAAGHRLKSYCWDVAAPTSVFAQSTLFDHEVARLYAVVNECQLLSDLAFADIVVWVPKPSGSFVAVSHLRPSSAPTLFYRDLVESEVPSEWRELVSEAYRFGRAADLPGTDVTGKSRARVRASPIRIDRTISSDSQDRSVIAVLTRHSNLSEPRVPSRQELTFGVCADDLLGMISDGRFPDSSSPASPTGPAPRASDGLVRLDSVAAVTYVSPNALSAFRRLGFRGELEGTELAAVTAELLSGTLIVDEALPLVVSGRASWQTDIQSNGVTVTLRSIPLVRKGQRVGAIVLVRDVTQLRLREKELITKDATIREIHHRVKNNLQTVTSLLRIQARRTVSAPAKESLNQAMRRVEAISIVHDTLSQGLNQSVDFDAVLERVLALVAELASATNQVVRPESRGSFGALPSEYATPLALVLTELVSNAVEHGLKGRQGGEIIIESSRSDKELTVLVRDNGKATWMGRVGDGLGTQIVRTLVEGELGGSIRWEARDGEGTEVVIRVPTQFLSDRVQP